MRIVVLPGDGIGPEITAVTVAAVEAASKKFNLDITEPLARISNGRQSGFEAVTVQLVPIGEDPKLSLLSVAVAVQ